MQCLEVKILFSESQRFFYTLILKRVIYSFKIRDSVNTIHTSKFDNRSIYSNI